MRSINSDEYRDADSDGIGDNADDDIDGDGISNEDDAFPQDNSETIDTDGDGIELLMPMMMAWSIG